jgi:branched-chain amino acid transport system substrate-binding protein
LLILIFTGCSNKKEEVIKIGFVAGLSGKYSSLGTSIRDGFILAFDEIDNKINGKKVEIIQKDDKQDKKEAKKIIEEFIKDGIKIVVGNATSSMTAVSFPIVNKQKDMLLFSATASSGEFSEQDDNFIRTQVEHSSKRYHALLDFIEENKIKDIFFIYDSNNYKYAKDYEHILQKSIVKNGGKKFVAKVTLDTPYDKIVNELKSTPHDLILIIGNSVDSANIIQYIRLNDIKSKILASGWAKTLDFIENGGKSVEGVLFATGYDDNSKDKLFVEFVKKYKKRYNKIPSVFAAQGYELAKILIQNLKESSDIKSLKKRILDKKVYKGLQGDIVFDKYGDVYREYFMMEVKNKEYRKIK